MRSLVHLFQTNQHFQAIEFVDRRVSESSKFNLSWRCVASIMQRFLVPVSMVSARNVWHNDPPFVYKIRRKTLGVLPHNWVGVCCMLPEALTLFQIWSPGAWRVIGARCYGTYMVGVNIKREMVLSPNDGKVASWKKHTQFKTRVHKPYPISDQNGRNL